MDLKQAEKKISELSETLKYHNRKYYLEDSPEIEDFEYDAMMRELEDLEKEYPQFAKEDSPTKMVGGAALKLFSPLNIRLRWRACRTFSVLTNCARLQTR